MNRFEKLMIEIEGTQGKLSELAERAEKDVPEPASLLHPKVVKLKGCRCATCRGNLAFKI